MSHTSFSWVPTYMSKWPYFSIRWEKHWKAQQSAASDYFCYWLMCRLFPQLINLPNYLVKCPNVFQSNLLKLLKHTHFVLSDKQLKNKYEAKNWGGIFDRNLILKNGNSLSVQRLTDQVSRPQCSPTLFALLRDPLFLTDTKWPDSCCWTNRLFTLQRSSEAIVQWEAAANEDEMKSIL